MEGHTGQTQIVADGYPTELSKDPRGTEISDYVQVASMHADITCTGALELSLAAAHVGQQKLQIPNNESPPIFTLPAKITAKIFVHFLPDYPERPPLTEPLSPTLRGQICRNWRDSIRHALVMESHRHIPPLQRTLIGCTTECAHYLAFTFEKLFSVSLLQDRFHIPETPPFHGRPHLAIGALGTYHITHSFRAPPRREERRYIKPSQWEKSIDGSAQHPSILGDSDRAHQRRLAPVGGVVARNFDGAAQTRLGASNGPNADESNM
ncbi:hypothetical protein C8J57DRAFT_1243956 [Mycena rebaudengoi]|nr:hypothetical protein C8J57DRAFT_1243956 [Mycena rebaudengoi]